MTRWLMASLVAFAAVLVAGSGCGYHVGSLVPSDIRTIYVPIFDNATFRRGLEFHLTEAVQRDIRRRTHLKLVGRDEADSILTGEIMDFRGALVVRDVNLRVIAEDVTISISFKWTERRTGRILAEASNVSNTVRLYAAGGETLGTATAESFRWLAEGIVDRMEGAW